MRSRRQPRLFSGRASTADRRDDRLHRGAQGRVRGRADLRDAADRPFHLLCREGPPPVSQATPRRGAHTRDHPRLRGESIRLRPPQGMVGTRATGVPVGPLHGRAPHARSGERLLPPDPQLAGLRLAPRTDLALGALEMALWRRGGDVDGLTINGLYKTEVIRKRGPWKTLEDVEFATLEWVDWFNNRRLLEYTGYIPPAELEEMYHLSLIHISEPTRLRRISYAVFCLKKK